MPGLSLINCKNNKFKFICEAQPHIEAVYNAENTHKYTPTTSKKAK